MFHLNRKAGAMTEAEEKERYARFAGSVQLLESQLRPNDWYISAGHGTDDKRQPVIYLYSTEHNNLTENLKFHGWQGFPVVVRVIPDGVKPAITQAENYLIFTDPNRTYRAGLPSVQKAVVELSDSEEQILKSLDQTQFLFNTMMIGIGYGDTEGDESKLFRDGLNELRRIIAVRVARRALRLCGKSDELFNGLNVNHAKVN